MELDIILSVMGATGEEILRQSKLYYRNHILTVFYTEWIVRG